MEKSYRDFIFTTIYKYITAVKKKHYFILGSFTTSPLIKKNVTFNLIKNTLLLCIYTLHDNVIFQ